MCARAIKVKDLHLTGDRLKVCRALLPDLTCLTQLEETGLLECDVSRFIDRIAGL